MSHLITLGLILALVMIVLVPTEAIPFLAVEILKWTVEVLVFRRLPSPF